MPKINGEKYPDTYLEVSRDKALRPLFLKQVSRDGDQALLSLLKAPANFDPQKYYKAFFAPDAAHLLKGFPDLIRRARALADAGGWHLIIEWKKLHRTATNKAMVSLNSKTLPKIYEMQAFRDHHFASVRRRVHVTDKMMKSLNVRNKAAMLDMVTALHLGDEDAARKHGKKALQQGPRETPDDVFALIRKHMR